MKNLGSRRFRSWLIVAVCAAMLTSPAPRKAEAQDIIEYALLAAFIALAAITGVAAEIHPNGAAYLRHLDRLENACAEAEAAHDDANPTKERVQLSRAGGAAAAMIGMTASCDAPVCDEAREGLKQAIGVIGQLKARTLIFDTCGNKVIDEGEECDPSVRPDVCGTRVLRSFCTADCFCQVVGGD